MTAPAAPTAMTTPRPPTPVPTRLSKLDHTWAPTARRQPQLAATARRYLDQISISLATSSVAVADQSLRMFCLFLADTHPGVTCFAEVNRPVIEDFKRWLIARPGAKLDTSATANTVRQRLGTIRTFFDRIIEWDWADAPARTPIFTVDLPIADDPLPKFLDDAQAAALLRTASSEADPLRRLVIHLLLRTGMRAGELCQLETAAVVTMRDGHWLRIPLGKLHNDRYIPLHPHLVELLTDWTSRHDDHGTGLLLTRDGHPLTVSRIARIVSRVATDAGLGHVHPHQLRHTFATQAVNRGMRIEAIGAMLGHRTLRMTLIYARIANRTVADEYRAVSDHVDALYADPDLPGKTADPAETEQMRRLRLEHRRMLGNGWCTRPAKLDCAFETICEGCGFFQTTIAFRDTLQAQHNDAATKGQDGRAELFQKLLDSPAARAAG
ncbi:MAG: site-specific integrase [Actinomycetota bacterium]|nr:site-specific integrase [Actinomycetota bacterium]